jgi:hypothetical protein
MPAGDEGLKLAQEREQGQAAALSLGRWRSKVRKACATETKVTWWFQRRRLALIERAQLLFYSFQRRPIGLHQLGGCLVNT